MAKQIIEEADIPQETSHVRVNPWAVQVDDFDQEETLYNMKKDGSLDAGVQTKSGIILPNELGNLKYIFQDLLAGDSSVMDTPEMKNINFNNIIKAIEWLASSNQLNDKEKTSLLSDGWRLNFKCKPPTPQEFLSEKFIGAQAESTYAWAKDTFCEFFDPLKPYRTLILAQHIGSGKAQPYSSKVAIDEEDVIDFNFENEVLTFNENDYILTQDGFKQAKNVIVNFPVPTNLIIMSIYDCRKIKEFGPAFKSENYNEIISFFKNFNQDFLEENEIKCHIHHILPKSEGGEDNEENLVKLPIYFHIKAHYLRGKELEQAGKISEAYKNYKAVQCAIDRNIEIPKNYKDFLKELDIVIESLEKKKYLDRKTKYVTDGKEFKRVLDSEVESYLANGWELKGPKKGNADRVWVNKDSKNYYILKSELQSKLTNGFQLGMFCTEKMKLAHNKCPMVSTLGTKWIHKNNERKCVNEDELTTYLSDGWIIGSGVKTTGGPKGKPHKKQGLHWYTDGKNNVQAIECPAGWKRGRAVCK